MFERLLQLALPTHNLDHRSQCGLLACLQDISSSVRGEQRDDPQLRAKPVKSSRTNRSKQQLPESPGR